jgi:ribosomal protein S18 acetylase RimI-like enzyme
VTFLTPGQVKGAQADFRQVYYQAFAAPPYSRAPAVADSFASALLRQLQRDDFRCVAALAPGFNGRSRVVGFAYGYDSLPGQWWHDLVARAMPPGQAADWLADAFELVELAVEPDAQGDGTGSELHDRLLAGLPHRNGLLSTMQAETTAQHLYRRRGWVTLLEGFYFPGGLKPYLIMGKRLQG